ncbi:hypothetical protein RhiirC2_827542 [Rhizophagus irregularis]|uniref:Uncharacterized protein n=1 Tax=Rhizophagus irregularis TaxID=588596 RepID=A0A2N1NCW4_9GLOM|nr:hypothetical protein RhiirC2_827542 [Rhizophagus irregularis]
MNKEEKEKRKQEIIEIIDKNEGIKVKRKEKVIKLKYIIEKFHMVTHACKALVHLNKRFKSSNHLANNYIRIHEVENKVINIFFFLIKKYEKMFSYIEHIIWKFAKYEPENFRLLDVRYNVMKNLILGDCDYLIKFILFGDEEETTESSVVRHIPNSELWPGKMFLRDDDLDFDESNDMLIGRELKDTNTISYFLEYYSRRATNYADWMCTVSKAIPLLFKYNYDDYARKLFSRECFINQDHSLIQDSNEIIPRVYLERRNHNIKFRAFSPIVKLKSVKYGWYDYWIRTPFKSLYDNIIKLKNDIVIMYENFDNELGKSTLALRVVPLPGFTTNNIVEKKVEYNFLKILLNIILLLFIPRLYKIGQSERIKLSPFSRTILCENDDTHDIYDNPAIEAVINFQWQKAKNFFFSLFIRFLVFANCFGVVLLKDPANIRMKDSTYSGVATNSLTNETFNIKLKSDFDPKSDDNPFTSFSKAIMAAYFWTSIEMNDNIEYLIKRFKSKNLIEEIEEIEEINDIKIDLKANVEKLHHKLEKLEKYEIL